MPGNAVNLLAFNGSHRSEKGFTEIALQKFLQGAKSAGTRLEILYPAKLKITPCASCGNCLFETPGKCSLKDDMGAVITKMHRADYLVFACPVYFDSMPSHLKKMVERLRSTLDAYFEFRNGRTHHLKIREKEQKVVTLFTAGNPEKVSFASISRIFSRIADNMGWQMAGEFHFPASHLLATEPQRLTRQFEAVALAGKEFASTGQIRRELLELANREYIGDPETILQQMTGMILEMRKNHGANGASL